MHGAGVVRQQQVALSQFIDQLLYCRLANAI
jgi:hypothetical protein